MTPNNPATEKRLLWLLAAVQFTNIVDFMVMMPLGPQLTQMFGINDAQFGALVSSYSLASGFIGLVGMAFVDRFDRKRLLLLAYAAFALATAACALASSYGLLMAARVAAGFAGGILTACVTTIVADTVPLERRASAMGTVMTAFALATVAGVPGALWLATLWGWPAPFWALSALAVPIGIAAWRVLPSLRAHLDLAPGAARLSSWQQVHSVLAEPNHWRAIAVIALLMFSSFTVIPFITLYTTANVGIRIEHVPVVYLVGGAATLFSARLIGRLADKHGKVRVFQVLVLLATLPVVAVTHMPAAPLWVVLIATTSFFVLVSGRSIPGMAIVGSAAVPQLRGAFMSLQGAVQSAAMGLAAFIGGQIISRDAQGMLQNYGVNSYLTVAVSLLAVWLVARVKMHS